MQFGEKEDFQREGELFRRMHDYGSALYHGNNCYVPPSAVDFLSEQYKRFNIPLDSMSENLLILCPATLIDISDYEDPYLLFWEYSDITMTNEWCDFTYELTEDGHVFYEAEPDKIESYRLIPGQADAFFNHHLAMPGLKALPPTLYHAVNSVWQEHLFGGTTPNATEYNMTTPLQVYSHLERIHTQPDGTVNDSRVTAVQDLGLWAATLWLLGPRSREFRECASDIAEITFQYGECILYQGEVISPEYYRRVDRPPRSCYKCGIISWCSELTIDDDGQLRNICEGCLTRGMKPRGGATCGTKFCRYFECPHNAYYQKGTAAVRDVMRTHGQLAGRAREQRQMLDRVNEEQKLLGS